METKLLAIGYRYNYNKSYLFKTITGELLGIIYQATAFYQNGKFEYDGSLKLIEKLKNELKEVV